MEPYSFFFECSKHETGIKQDIFVQLALGHCGLIIKRKHCNVLVLSDGEFVIPKTFSLDAYKKLSKNLWKENSEFHRIQHIIMKAKKTWANTKKRDKLRLIDQFVLDRKLSFEESIHVKALLTLKIILKLIDASDIIYTDNKILSIKIEKLKI